MKYKIIIFLILTPFFFFLTQKSYSSFQLFQDNPGGGINPGRGIACNALVNSRYIYVRVLIDGVWWIWVYDEDGNKIMEYIDDD